MILLWWGGSSGDIPTQYSLCDGTNGTPDLRERFIRGAISDSEVTPGTTGGESEHDHSISSASHSHSVDDHTHSHSVTSGSDFQARDAYRNLRSFTHDHGGTSSSVSHAHSIGDASSLPSYKEIIIVGCDDESLINEFLPGCIVMWSGDISEIPTGWAFCDGDNGTPDLKGKFIRGSSAAGGEGGSSSHSHSLGTDGEHSHTSQNRSLSGHVHGTTSFGTGNIYGGDLDRAVAAMDFSHTHNLEDSGDHNHGGLTAKTTLPPWYALAFIMKMEEE